ncbi:MAG: TFIIB-type zinc ribbon-containing protein [Enterococcus sp.]
MDVLTHKCPNCGGALTFDPKDQKFHCPYCLSIFTEEEVTLYEEQQRKARMDDTLEQTTTESNEGPDSTEQESMDSSEEEQVDQTTQSETTKEDALELFLCPSCGAEIATDATTAATYCYYCHNPVVLSGRLSGDFLPEKVLPFAIEKEEAVEKFLAWTKKKRFIPKAFFSKEQIDTLTGVYFPYWSVDAELSGELDATGTRLRVWRVGDIEYTETKQFAVKRKGNLSFKELVKNALSKNTQQKMVESVQPFPIQQAVDFKSQYLSGFQAEKRDIEFIDLREPVVKELKEYSQNMLQQTATGYTTLTNVRSQISLDSEAEHYMLLPVWLVTYRSHESSKKIYYYAMNGQTGRTSGVLPVSYKRLGLATAGIVAALLGVFLLGGYFLL